MSSAALGTSTLVTSTVSAAAPPPTTSVAAGGNGGAGGGGGAAGSNSGLSQTQITALQTSLSSSLVLLDSSFDP